MNRFARWLLRLFPPAFRDAFGPELLDFVRTEQARARDRGRARALWAGLGATADLVRSGLAERWRPTWSSGPAGPDPKRSGGMMTGWWKDLQLAARALGRARGLTAVTVLTLGAAIGAHAGIFSVVDAVLLDPLPFDEPERLVYIGATAPGSDFPAEFGVSAEFLVQYREEATHLASVAHYNWFTATLRAGDRVERIPMSWPTLSLFETLGATPVLGRLPTPEEEDGVVVISHALWATWFGQDPDVIGRAYDIAGRSRTVVGVMGPEFRFPRDDVLLWIPNQIRAEDITPGRFGMSLVGRVAPGVSEEELAAQLTAVADRLPERFGGSPAYARLIEQHRPVVRPLQDHLLGPVSGALWVLMGSVTLVLLIACANIANLLLVRAERRQRDMAVRQAMGAGTGQLVRGQMAEAAILAALGGAVGAFIAWVGAPLLLQAAPDDIPRADQVGLDLVTVGSILATSAFAAVACGLFPALRASRSSLTSLREAGRGATRRWGTNSLVVAQTALALVLLVGSGLLIRSFQELRSVDPGYDLEDIYTFQIAPEEEHLDDGPSFARFHVDFMARLAALPGVESVGLVENLPLNEGTRGTRFLGEGVADTEDQGALVDFTFAAGDYFPTMGIALLRGRVFAGDDHRTEVGNVILSASAAELLWPGQDPIGRRVRQTTREGDVWETVIGVVEDVRQFTFREASDPLLYRPMVGPDSTAWVLSSPAYVVRTSRTDQIGAEIRDLVREVSPSAPMYRTYTMEGLAADSMANLSFTMLTLGVAAGLALLLGALGLYGVLSYVVTQRTQEIGVRMTLGAKAREVQRMVVAQGARVVLLGVGLGVGLAALVTRALGALLYGVEALDVTTFVAMSGMMLTIGLLASYVPARRASSVDPIEALRIE